MGPGFGRFGRDVSAYLLLMVGISMLGPLMSGFHLGELNAPQDVITCAASKSSSVPQLLSSFLGRAKESSSTSITSLPQCISMTDVHFAVVSSIYTMGGLIGALVFGPVMSSKGRLLAMRLAAALSIVGASVETISASIGSLALGRFLVGVGAGGSSVTVPLYISEVAPPAYTGFFGSFTQISLNVGILTVQTLGYFLSYGNAWRWILAVGVILAVCQAMGSFVLPESPIWLATTKTDVTKARRTLQRIRGHDVPVDHEVEGWLAGVATDGSSEEDALLSHDNGEQGASKQTIPHFGFLRVIKDSHTRPAIIAVVGIMFAQQLCGITSIIMYSVSLLDGLLPIESSLLTIIMSAINLLTTIGASPLPDRLGRKTCLLLSIAGQGISTFVLAFSLIFGLKILSAITVLFFMGFFAAGLGPVPFIIGSELVGQEAVSTTQSWSSAANYTATFLVAQFFPIVNDALNERFGGGGWVFFIFAALSVVSAFFVYIIVPETLGKKDADEVWGRTGRQD